jgi:hypothetical protein
MAQSNSFVTAHSRLSGIQCARDLSHSLAKAAIDSVDARAIKID